MGATFLVCHGAWSAGWAWKKMHPLMAAAGPQRATQRSLSCIWLVQARSLPCFNNMPDHTLCELV
jgi:hypothetical protein